MRSRCLVAFFVHRSGCPYELFTFLGIGFSSPLWLSAIWFCRPCTFFPFIFCLFWLSIVLPVVCSAPFWLSVSAGHSTRCQFSFFLLFILAVCFDICFCFVSLLRPRSRCAFRLFLPAWSCSVSSFCLRRSGGPFWVLILLGLFVSAALRLSGLGFGLVYFVCPLPLFAGIPWFRRKDRRGRAPPTGVLVPFRRPEAGTFRAHTGTAVVVVVGVIFNSSNRSCRSSSSVVRAVTFVEYVL